MTRKHSDDQSFTYEEYLDNFVVAQPADFSDEGEEDFADELANETLQVFETALSTS